MIRVTIEYNKSPNITRQSYHMTRDQFDLFEKITVTNKNILVIKTETVKEWSAEDVLNDLQFDPFKPLK